MTMIERDEGENEERVRGERSFGKVEIVRVERRRR